MLCCQLRTIKFWPVTGPNCVKWRWWTWFSQRVMSIMLHRPQLSVFSRTSHPPLSLKMHIFLFPLFVCCHWPSCAPPPRPCLIFHGWAGGGSASDHISPLAGLPISQPPSQLPRTILRTTAPTVKVWVCPRASSSSSLSSSSSSLSSPPSADCAVGIVRLPASQWHNQVLPHHDHDSDDHDDFADDCAYDEGPVKHFREKQPTTASQLHNQALPHHDHYDDRVIKAPKKILKNKKSEYTSHQLKWTITVPAHVLGGDRCQYFQWASIRGLCYFASS